MWQVQLKKLWYFSFQRIVQLWNWLYFGMRVRGQQQIHMTGPLLVISNHQSNWDPPLIGTSCPRMLNYLAKESLFRFAPLGWLIRSFNAIPLDRDGGGLAGIKETLKRLKRDEAVLIFPEGTRSPNGQLQSLKPGFIPLVRRTGAMIQPVAIAGMYQCWPRRQAVPRPGRVCIQYATPLTSEQIAGWDDTELLAQIEQQLALALDQANQWLASR